MTDDPTIVFEDIDEFVDPLIIAPVGCDTGEVLGIQLHHCPQADGDRIYVVDRPNVVDQWGMCLVCGGETV